MDIDKEKKEILFDLFKNQLISFLEEEFNVCKNSKIEMNDCKDNKELRNVLKKYRDDIYEKLGGELFDNQEDEIERLEWKIGDLENVIDDLKHEFIDKNGKTLNDAYKLGFYLEYKDKYTPWELEELLKNGK